MSKSILQNIPEVDQLLSMETEDLAGYVLEHLHACGGNPLSQGNSLPHNLANDLGPRYSQKRDEVFKRIVAVCHWLINNGYLDVINAQGFYEISKKGNRVKTASDLISQLNQRADSSRNQGTPDRPDSLYKFPKIELSDSELMWLQIIVKRFLSGYLTDINQLKKSLHAQGKWPRNFRPSEIDYRLFQRENIPTLLGVWHADPESPWIARCDELIRYIKVKLPTTKEIKVSDIAESIGLSESDVSLLIHLLPSVGLYYTAIGKPLPTNRVSLPGQLGTYSILQLDDPEKMDAYLAYENLERQIDKVFGDENPIEDHEATNKEDLFTANQLYDKVKSLIQNSKALNENEARIVVESADDALKEFGNTNQEKKVELRKWKAQAELVLPPASIEDLRKRAEAQLLRKSYPKSRRLRNALFIILALMSLVAIGLGVKRVLVDQSSAPRTTASPAPLVHTSNEANDAVTNSDSVDSDAQIEKQKPALTRLEAEVLIQKESRTIEQCIAGVEGCLYLDFAFSHSDEGGMNIDVFVGKEVERVRLFDPKINKAGIFTSLPGGQSPRRSTKPKLYFVADSFSFHPAYITVAETEGKMSGLAPRVNGCLISRFQLAFQRYRLRNNTPFVHRYITDSGRKLVEPL